MKIRLGLFLLIPLVFAACDLEESKYDKQVRDDAKEIKDYLEANQIDAEKSIYDYWFEELVNNDDGDQPQFGDIVSFKYKISDLEGNVLEDSLGTDDEPVVYRFFTGTMLPEGLDYAIGRMLTGEKYRFYIPSYLAYFNYSLEDINAYTNFIVDVELIEILDGDTIKSNQIDSIDSYLEMNSIESDSILEEGLYIIHTDTGSGNKPAKYDKVQINFTRMYLDGEVINSTADGDPVSFYLNRGVAVDGLEEGILTMREGGKATIIMTYDYAFGSGLRVVPSYLIDQLWEYGLIGNRVEPYSIIKYDVELISTQ